jgi:hypothetical protein
MEADDISRYLALATEAKQRAEQATPGPWDQPDRAWCDLGEVWPASRGSTHDGMAIAYDITHTGDVAFIAAARTDVPELADAVEALAAEVRRLTALAMAVDLLQAENRVLRADVERMAPLYYIHQAPPDGVTYTVHKSISSQEQP